MSGVVVVGAGQAALQLAVSLREEGFAGPVTLLGEEPAAPYQRPPLSKAFLTGAADAGSCLLRPPEFYAAQGIALRTGVRVVALDRGARRIRLESGESLGFDHLVLATGARPRALRIPGAELPGVLALRTLADAAALRDALAAARRMVVVGAGFIGLEVAAVAAARGVAVTVLDVAPRPMARAVSALTAGALRARHESGGIRFRFGVAVARILGAGGRAAGVELADGARLPAELVLAGIGAEPATELAATAGLAVGRGVLVDELLRTADPSVSAIGDCAAMPGPDGPAPLESVQAAVDGARCVAARIAGRPRPYAALPWFWSDQGGAKLQIAGLGAGHDLAVPRGDPGSGAFSVFLYRGGRLAAVESVGRPGDHMQARRILGAGLHLPPEAAADAALALKSVGAAA